MTETRESRMPDGLTNSISSFLKRTDHLRDFNRSCCPFSAQACMVCSGDLKRQCHDRFLALFFHENSSSGLVRGTWGHDIYCFKAFKEMFELEINSLPGYMQRPGSFYLVCLSTPWRLLHQGASTPPCFLHQGVACSKSSQGTLIGKEKK